ncbi:DUF6311 domain-containing protein [Caulobacter segnis]|uniref:DUF6311 domain-containing protein n=1 Tax=Caulobacter segnis TaxID=88688 RepID=UPI00240F1220|nr:DUF6311 domain-containing protein [Caulobacter segnis]MDG2523404.1 DUF6311 domain-containing protein [Caulobacter segnis]
MTKKSRAALKLDINLAGEDAGFRGAVALAAVIGVFLFGYMFGFDLPLASATFWSMPKSDMVAMTGGYEAFIRAPWGFPITMVSSLTPEPTPIVFTDSIPWLSVLLKASGLGAWFNPLGLFLLISYPLQAIAMGALMRALGVTRPWPVLVACLIALMFPAWIIRQFGHIALCGHWILLFSLALSVSMARNGLERRHTVGFTVLGVLAAGIHAYHLVPVAACLGAGLLSVLLQNGPRSLPRVLISGATVSAGIVISALILGYREGAGPTGGADSLGFYSMNMVAPFWPQASNLWGQDWTGSWFAKSLDANGGQIFEGFQYLGAGALLLVAPLIIAFIRADLPTRQALVRWGPLALAMTALTVWAIGWNGYFGTLQVYAAPKPSGKMAEIIGGFRAHGRFFWVVGYLLIALGVAWAARLPRRVSAVVLLSALLLQAYDTVQMRLAVRQTFDTPAGKLYPASLDNAAAVKGRPWIFAPTYFCSPNGQDQHVISQMNLMILRGGGTTNTYATARSRDAACDITPAGYTQDAAPGDRRIIVVTSNDQYEGGALQPIAARTDCYRFKRGAICGRDLDGIDGLTRVKPGELSSSARQLVAAIRMDQGVKPANLTTGWSAAEQGAKGIWSIGPKATLSVNGPARLEAERSLMLEMTLIGFSDAPLRPQAVAISVGGRKIADLTVEPGVFTTHRIGVPQEYVQAGQPVVLTLDLPDARASAADPRVLGVAIQQLRVLY